MDKLLPDKYFDLILFGAGIFCGVFASVAGFLISRFF